jgi:hypothetical protein
VTRAPWLVAIGEPKSPSVENIGFLALTGGRGGIRTHGTLAGTPVFKTGALNHSATLPSLEFRDLAETFRGRKRPRPRHYAPERRAVAQMMDW